MVSEAALKDRARTMLVAMTERERWIYALPREGTLAAITALMAEKGIPRVADEAEGIVARYQDERGKLNVVVFDNEQLDIVLLHGSGAGSVATLKAVLDVTSFCAQSKLWAGALDIGNPEATRALKILAHMMVCWDDDWVDLFVLHLASPDAIVRNEATLALVVAAMVAQEVDPALELLAEAEKREKFPQLQETMAEATRVLRGFDGRVITPIDSAPE